MSAVDSAPINILIVDDEPKNLVVLETLLDAPGYRLVRAESADQALLALVAEEFALLILDIRMPGMTGFELAQIIKGRKKTAQIPIIFLTAYYNEDQHILEGYGSGAVDYLHKPVNAAVLRSKVAIFAELHRKGREVAISNRTLLAEVTERRRVEEQLRELNELLDRRVAERTEALHVSDTRLRMTTDAVELAIWAWQLSDDGWVWENDWATAIFGVPLESCPSSSAALAAMVDHRDRETFDHAAEATRLSGAIFHFEGRVQRLDGATRWIELDGSCVADSAGAARVLGTIRDATARRRTEQALRESEARYRTLFHSIDEGFCVIDLSVDADSRPVDFTFTECNLAFQKHSGLSDVAGKRASEVIPDLEQRWLDTFSNVARDGESIRLQGEIKALNRIVEIYAFRLGSAANRRVAILFRDVTERLRAEEALRERERFLRTVTGAARIGLAVVEPGDTFRFANEAFAQMLGTSVRDIVGRPFEAVMADARSLSHQHLRRAFDDNRVAFEFSLSTSSTTSAARHFGAFLEPHVDQDGARTVAVVMVEISELKRLESELRETDRRKDEFLATLAHELRNPLAPVRNAIQILNLKASASKEVSWAGGVIERQIRVMVRLIDDLMDVTRINQGRIELRLAPVALASVLALAIESSRFQIDEFGHELTVTQPDEPVSVNADQTRLSQVFMNLITNAAKYTDKGGRIQVSVQRVGTDVRIAILDNGIGIDPEHLPGVFNMFSQVESALTRSRGGLGIGLSLAKRLVELHGGHVEARSEGVGRGSEFSVFLPVMKPDLQEPDQGTAPGENVPRQPRSALRILVVDDNVDGADSLTTLLRLQGHQVGTAYGGETGLREAEALRPDVILLDIGMPGMSGYETCRRLRGQVWGSAITVIATTGWGDPEARRAVKEAGFDAHLVKPLDEGVLLDALGKIRSA